MDKHILRLMLKILLPASGWLLLFKYCDPDSYLLSYLRVGAEVSPVFHALCDRLADLHAGQSAGAFS